MKNRSLLAVRGADDVGGNTPQIIQRQGANSHTDAAGLPSSSKHPERPGQGKGGIGLLVAIAAIVLLFTGRYPNSIYEFVLGMNRWVFRVAAYASLMTDDYPPFRLDMGGTEPAVDSAGTDVVTPPTPAPTPTSPAA